MKKLFTILAAVILTANVFAQTVDYNLPQNWMCHPVLKSTDIAREQNLTLTVINPDLSIDTVLNYTPTTDTSVDIFYVYPTIDMGYKLGNTTMDSIDTLTAKFVYSEQVGIYSQFGRVFVPYYRQAKIKVFLDTSTSAATQLTKANCMETAYNDIDSAFSHYLQHYNKGHKIILMGHSQGAYLIRFLLRKRFDNDPALRSLLIVAISGGEANYASADGSRTGGSLQNIKTCPPRDSAQECGCIINWRTWNTDYPGNNLERSSFFFNPNFVDKGFIYQTYDTINHSHIESYYDFGYAAHKTMARYISLDSSALNYVGFNSMFGAEITSDLAVHGSTYLLIDSIPTPNDHRKILSFPSFLNSFLQSTIPIPNQNSYHIWDMQFVQYDLLQILPQLIASCNTTGIQEQKLQQDNILIYPNPTNGMVHVSCDNQKIKSTKLHNLQGELIREYFVNDFSVADIASGIYFITIQTDKSTFVHKLLKQ